MKPVTIPANTTSFTIDNVTTGQLPKRQFVCFLRREAYDGHYQHNMYNYEHINLTRIALYANGRCIPHIPFTPVFTGDNPEYGRLYASVFSVLGLRGSNRGIAIHRDEYPGGYCLIGFDLTTGKTAHLASPLALKKTGNTRLVFTLSARTDNAYVCLIFSEYDNMLKIDGDRNMYVNFTQ